MPCLLTFLMLVLLQETDGDILCPYPQKTTRINLLRRTTKNQSSTPFEINLLYEKLPRSGNLRSETFCREPAEVQHVTPDSLTVPTKAGVQEPKDNSKHTPSLSLQSQVVKSDALAAFQR